MKCKFCGRELEDDAVYCFYCGKRLDGKKPCPSCNALLPEDATFCGKCGARIAPEALKDEPKAENGSTEQQLTFDEMTDKPEQEVTEQATPEQTMSEPEVTEPEEPEQEVAEQTMSEQAMPEQEETEQETPEQAVSEQEVTEQEEAEQDSPEAEPKKLELSEKWKKVLKITQLCLAGFVALIGFIFTFCIGVTLKAPGLTSNTSIFDYFGKVYENLDNVIIVNNLGDTQSFALYLPYIFGTLIAVAALVCNLTFTIMTVVALIRQYAYKNQKVNFIKHAFRTFISYMVFATLFFALNAATQKFGGVKSSVYFNGATIAALIIGGIAFGGYFAGNVVLRLNDFTDKKEIVKNSVALGTGVIGIVVAALLAFPVCRFSTANYKYSLGLMSMIHQSAYELSDGTNCGGVMCFGIIAFAVQIALLVLTVCIIVTLARRVGSGSGKKPLGLAIAVAALSVLYFLGAFATANMLNAEAPVGSVSYSYGVPVTVIVFSFIMLGGVVATIILDKIFKRNV